MSSKKRTPLWFIIGIIASVLIVIALGVLTVAATGKIEGQGGVNQQAIADVVTAHSGHTATNFDKTPNASAQTSQNITATTSTAVEAPSLIITNANNGLIQITTSPNGKMFVTTGTYANGISRLWTIDGQLIANLSSTPDVDYKNSPTASAVPNAAVWSPDSETLATSADSKEIQIWDTAGKLQKTLAGHTDKVSNLAWSPNGQYLASGSADNNVIIWDKDGKLLYILKGHTGPISKVAWSPDGNILATIASGYLSGSQTIEDNTLWLWDSKGQLVSKVTNSDSKLSYTNIAWSPDGKILAAGSADGGISFYNPDGSKIKSFRVGSEEVGPIEWSPNGKTLAVGDDTQIYLLDQSASVIATLIGNTNIVGSLAWSHSGNFLASGDGSGVIILWVANGNKLETLSNNALAGPIISLGWTPDDKTLISGSHNGSIVFWK